MKQYSIHAFSSVSSYGKHGKFGEQVHVRQSCNLELLSAAPKATVVKFFVHIHVAVKTSHMHHNRKMCPKGCYIVTLLHCKYKI